MTVDGLPAVCSSNLCGYNYIAPVPSITDFSFSGSVLTIIGTDFPALEDLRSVTLAHHECTITSSSDT
jgi:hypothetical protein